MKTIIRTIMIVCCLLIAGTLFEGIFTDGIIAEKANARIGRPLTPGSYAGVARRTTRRTIRRTSVYVATLPAGCTTVVIEGTSLYQCGGTYYQSENNQYVVVEVD